MVGVRTFYVEKATQATNEVRPLGRLEGGKVRVIGELPHGGSSAAGKHVDGVLRRNDPAFVHELAILHRREEPREPAIRRALSRRIEFVEEDDRHSIVLLEYARKDSSKSM